MSMRQKCRLLYIYSIVEKQNPGDIKKLKQISLRNIPGSL